MRRTVVASFVATVLVFALLVPTSGNDSDPPECFSMLGYVVPCGFGPDQSQGMGFALAGAIVAATLIVIGSAVGRREPVDG